MIEIEGVRPSAEIRADLAAEGRPVLLAFSCGKDALAAWLARVETGRLVHHRDCHGISGGAVVRPARHQRVAVGLPRGST